jgi:hypothetical protein
MAPFLKDMEFLLSRLIFFLHLHFWFFFTNWMAYIFAVLNCMVFHSAYYIAIFVHFSSVSTISITLAPVVIENRLSMKEIATVPILSSTSSKTPNIYIVNRIRDTRELYGILQCGGFIAISWSLVISDMYLSLIKLSVYLISCGSTLSSSRYLLSLV